MPDLLLQIPTAIHPHPKPMPVSPSSPCTTGCSFGSPHQHILDHSQDPSTSSTPDRVFATNNGQERPSTSSSTSGIYDTIDSTSLADLLAVYGTASSTAWLDTERYKIWRPSQPIPESEFTPVQGYIQRDPFIFAWGNPLVSSHAALEKTARAFIAFAEANHLRPVWACVDSELEAVLASEALGWVTVSCIYEEVMDPAHIIELTTMEKGQEGTHDTHAVHDLRKNLHRAEGEHVHVNEVKAGEWDEKDRHAVEEGVKEWKIHKHAMALESMTVEPWMDEAHRRYWIAKRKDKVIGVQILTRTGPMSWQIIKCLTFRHAPKGTSEALIHAALKDLYAEQEALVTASSEPPPAIEVPEGHPAVEEAPPVPAESQPMHKNRITLSFGITAADHLEPGHNVSGWKVSVLGKTYQAVSGIVGLIKTGQYRSKFQAKHEPMYVCYPANGFGLIAVGALLMAMRK